MFEAKKKTDGTYEVFKDNVRQTTGSANILGNYGLSETKLRSDLQAPTAIGNSSPAPVNTTPKVQDFGGIGTLTITPKTPMNMGTPIQEPNKLDNASGLYERTGVTAPPAYTIQSGDTLSAISKRTGLSINEIMALNPTIKDPNKIQAGATLNLGGGQTSSNTQANTQNSPVAPAPIPGLPSYPTKAETPQAGILDSYNSLLKSITTIEEKIKSNSTPSEQEKQLAKELADKKAQLALFDVGVEKRVNDFYGQGRGATLSSIGIKETQERRSSALERLGLATEANNLISQLQLSQDERKAMGDLAMTEYNLSTKKLDIALGIQKELDRLNDEDKSDARQYLLDVVAFAGAKTYDQLDNATQSEILKAVANSPITLDMVKTALSSASEKARASANGELRSVAGVGVVQISPNGTYKVVVPENPSPSPTNSNTPTFEDYFASQNIPFNSVTPEKVEALRAEYNNKYPATTVNLGKLTQTNKNDLTQAGLISAPAPVQSYFLNSPSEFRDQYQRDVASGKAPKTATLNDITTLYTNWYNEQQAKKKTSGTRDWASLLGTTTPAK